MLKDQLRKARLAAGKTQQEVAEHICVNYSTYSSYETGRREPDALKIKKIAAFLGVTGDYLLETGFEEEASGSPKATETIECKEPDEVHLIKSYRTLNSSGKAAAVSAVDGLASNPSFREEGSNLKTA